MVDLGASSLCLGGRVSPHTATGGDVREPLPWTGSMPSETKKLSNEFQTRHRGRKILLLSCSGRNSTLTDLQHIVQHQEPQNDNITLQSTTDWWMVLIQENDRILILMMSQWKLQPK